MRQVGASQAGSYRQRAGRAAGIILVNAGLLALVLVIMEVCLAAAAPDLPVNGRTAHGHFTWGHRVTHNSLGFRERDFATPKPDGVSRIMVLGDSLTWGAGLAMDQRYTATAERLLNERVPGSMEVLNFGVMGGPTTQERDILREHVDAVEPDLLVVGFCLNDIQPRVQNYSPERARFDGGAGRVARRLASLLAGYGLPRVGDLIQMGWYGVAEMTGVIPTWQVALQRTYQAGSPEWRAFEAALAEMKAMSDARGLPAPLFAILNQGTSTREPTDYAHPDKDLALFLDWYHRAEAAARRAGFVTYHHEVEIAARLADESLAVNVLDGHPSANLNRLYGQKLSAMAARQLNLASGAPAPPSLARRNLP